jgi:hypothetical protein
MNIVNGVITLFVGGVALLVYWLSKRNEKRNAATIIIMDVRHAESVVTSILERGFVDKDTKDVLTENNWKKYKHLFASDFSQDDFVSFNRFFESCAEMSDARNRLKEIFYSGLNAKAVIMQEKVLSISELESVEGKAERDKIISQINKEFCVFDPSEPRDRIMKSLQLMGRLSNTVAFEKLKSKAGIKA